MGDRVCPPWVGYLLLNPLRKLFENPDTLVGPHVRTGMTILEPGCGMGYFTLPLARLTGAEGRVIAVDIQERMLSALRRRAEKAGLLERIDIRKNDPEGLKVDDLTGGVDLAVAIHVVHEVPDERCFFEAVWKALKDQGGLLFVEPRHHVSRKQFEQSVAIAGQVGFQMDPSFSRTKKRKALLIKPKPMPAAS